MTFVLTYHDVASASRQESVGFPGPKAARYKLTPEHFDRHLETIAETGAEIGLLDDPARRPAAALTFDDGGASAHHIAVALERYGWKGHFFVPTSKVGTPGFLTAEELIELAGKGHVVGGHSHTHPTYMGRLDRESLDGEWNESRSRLGEILGAEPDIASVPGGFVTPAVIDSAAAAGYRILLTSEPRSRPLRAGPVLVLGRYAIWSTTPAATAARYARGESLARWQLLLEWKAKTAAKRLSPALYERARLVRAARTAD